MNGIYPQQMYQRPTQMNNGITWVQGIEGAKAFQLMPNSNAILMDSENDGKFYIKVADSVGMCKLRIFNYEEVTEETSAQIDMSQYVTRDELNEMIQSILGGKAHEQSVPATQRKSKSLITE